MSVETAESRPTKKSAFKNKHSTYERDPLDFYVDPPFCTEGLARYVDLHQGITWDPAAGSGTIPRVLRNRGHIAVGSDIVHRSGRSLEPEIDFLHDDPPWAFDYICTNPPYSLAEAFIRRAHELKARKIAVLVRLDFLASQRRHKLFTEDHPPQLVLVLSRRPSMPPGPIKPGIKRAGGQHDFMWLVWDSMKAWHPCEVRWVK